MVRKIVGTISTRIIIALITLATIPDQRVVPGGRQSWYHQSHHPGNNADPDVK